MKKVFLQFGMMLLLGAALSFAACGNQQSGSEAGEHTEAHDHAGHADHDHDHSAETNTSGAAHGEGKEYTSAYICPMHCEGSGSSEAGKCPVCGMSYVAQAEHTKDGHKH